MKITIKYELEVNEQEFKGLLKEAQDFGYDHSDAGPQLTVRRFLAQSGLGSLDDLQLADKLASRVKEIP